jgi:hypothetical protein
MAWLARENLHDSSTARSLFAAAKADLEMEIKSAVLAVPISEPRKETPTPQASAKPRGETPTPQVKADMSCKRDRWTRLTKTIVMTVAVVALAGFVGGYNTHVPNSPADIAVAGSPEVRRAIPVAPEIRKAIPVETREIYRRSDSMAFISPGRAIARDFATRPREYQPARRETSRSVIGRKASK